MLNYWSRFILHVYPILKRSRHGDMCQIILDITLLSWRHELDHTIYNVVVMEIWIRSHRI